MSRTLDTWNKQPDDTDDGDVSFSAWLKARADSIATFTVTAEDGITVGSSIEVDDPDVPDFSGGMIKVFYSGGTSGSKYKITVQIATVGGRIKSGEVTVKIKEI